MGKNSVAISCDDNNDNDADKVMKAKISLLPVCLFAVLYFSEILFLWVSFCE